MLEYAISDGEGTLLDYGMTNEMEIVDLQDDSVALGRTMIFGPAGDDCATGQ